MTTKRPDWVKTNVPWEIKKEIWACWALGDTVEKTVISFQLNDKAKGKYDIHRDTISKVRQELLELPIVLLTKLIREKPETKYLIDQERPEVKGQLKSEVDAAQTTGKIRIYDREDPVMVDARRQHFIDMREFGRQFILLLDQYESWGWGLMSQRGKLSPPKDLGIDYDHLIDSQQFEWLKQHVPNDKVWHTYDQLHFFLSASQIICAVIDDHDDSDFINEIRGIIEIAQDDGYYNSEVVSQCISLIEWESTSSRDILWKPLHIMHLLLNEVKEGINLAISRGVFPGTCPACPFNYRTESPG